MTDEQKEKAWSGGVLGDKQRHYADLRFENFYDDFFNYVKVFFFYKNVKTNHGYVRI